MAKRLIPLLDRVLVEKVKKDAKTAAGILLPDSAAGKMNEGMVVAVGPGRLNRDGALVPPSLKAGDKVLLPEFGGQALKMEGKDGVLYNHDDILAKFE